MKIKAPRITSLKIERLSANHLLLAWDNVGINFYYMLEIAESRTANGEKIPENKRVWVKMGYTPEPKWYETTHINPDTYYIVRIGTRSKGFEISDYVYTEEFQTFETNAYTITKDKSLTLSDRFIDRRLTKNDFTYINFNNDQFWASLMAEDFNYVPTIHNITQVQDKVLFEEEYHEIQSNIERVCGDRNRTYIAEFDGLLYLFERWQKMAKVSNDKGQTWYYYDALDDRVGYPLSRNVVYQNSSTSYVLGYDRIFHGRLAGDERWSSDIIKMSSSEVSFTKLDQDVDLGFDVHVFNTFAYLPADVSKIAEGMATSEKFIWVGGKNIVRFLDIENAVIDNDNGSHSYGKRLFDEKILKVVPKNDKVVIKKMDSVNGELLVLVTGEIKKIGLDPRTASNVIASKDAGVYLLDQENGVFNRVFGNTEIERRVIEHQYTDMSTDGRDVNISYTNFKYTKFQEMEVSGEEAYKLTAIKDTRHAYLSDKAYHYGVFKTVDQDLTKWAEAPAKYYSESKFNWMAKTGTRCWINNENHVVMVYPFSTHTKIIEFNEPTSSNRLMKEISDMGIYTFFCDNITFEEFKKFAGGIMIHNWKGDIVGYYEFTYRVKDEATIIWKPKNVIFSAELQNQVRDKHWRPEVTETLRDPDLRPLLHRMAPDNYLKDDTNFKAFCDYYLQFISDGNMTAYNKLLNLIKLKYPREENAYEYLWSEINKRNIYLDQDKKDAVVRLFESRKTDFYSRKGVEESYKFLFKLLYNEDVEIETESSAGLEYDIYIESNNINEDIVGTSIYTKTGRCNVTYIDRRYIDKKLVWVVTIHNMIGRFYEGQEILSEYTSMKGMVVRGIKGKELFDNSIEYINRGRSYYVMKIRSTLPTSRYNNDILRFVHPTGFGFIGITVLTMFINSGLSMRHTETIIEKLLNYRFDMGLPKYWPDRVIKFDVFGNPQRDPQSNEIIYGVHPKAREPFDIDIDKYNKDNGWDPAKKSNFKPTYSSKDDYLNSVSPADRRFDYSPTFDQSAVGFSQFRTLATLLVDGPNLNRRDGRLKDNIGNPRDPVEPTQYNAGKENA